MWEKAAFLSFYASLCIAQRVAIANLGERQLNASSENSLSSLVGATRLPASASQDLAQSSAQLPTRQAGASVTVTNAATANNPTVVVVGLSPSDASQLGTLAQSNNPSATETIPFTPTTKEPLEGIPLTSFTVSENFNSATAIPISFPSNGVPQVPSILVSQISATEQAAHTATNAAQVISSKLASIDSVHASQASAGISQMSVSLPAQDTATGSIFFTIPIPSVETAATSNPVSNGATTIPLPFPGTISSISSVSSVPSTLASTTNPSSTISSSATLSSSITSSSSTSPTRSSSSSSSSTSRLPTSSMSATSSSATTLPSDSLKRTQPLSGGAIAGIVVGVAAALIVLGAVLLWLLRRKTHQPVPQSPHVYPEEAYLYDPPIGAPPRAMSPARPGANGFAASPGFPPPGFAPPEMTQAQAEREGLLGAGALGAGAAAGAAAAHRRQVSTGSEYADHARPVDPFADPPSQAEQERWPLNPEGHNGTLHPEDMDPGPGYVTGSSAGPSRDGPQAGGPIGEGGIGQAVSPSAYEGDEGAGAAGVGGLGGRSVGPHNHDIPGRYGPGGIMRGGNGGRLRTSGMSPGGGPSSAGVSPGLRDVRRAWGWEP